MLYIQQIIHSNRVSQNNLYKGKKIKIQNLSYVCIESLKTLSHIDQKDYSVRHHLYFQPGSWILQGSHNSMYYIMSDYKLTKTSPYYLYNSKRFSNNSTIEDLLEKCGVYQKALKECA
jgi:hypothetical protein